MPASSPLFSGCGCAGNIPCSRHAVVYPSRVVNRVRCLAFCARRDRTGPDMNLPRPRARPGRARQAPIPGMLHIMPVIDHTESIATEVQRWMYQTRQIRKWSPPVRARQTLTWVCPGGDDVHVEDGSHMTWDAPGAPDSVPDCEAETGRSRPAHCGRPGKPRDCRPDLSPPPWDRLACRGPWPGRLRRRRDT